MLPSCGVMNAERKLSYSEIWSIGQNAGVKMRVMAKIGWNVRQREQLHERNSAMRWNNQDAEE